MPFAWFLAMRFFREGRTQTLLIVAGVSVGVSVMVFLSALIGGLQESLIAQTLGTQANIVVRPPEEAARPVAAPHEEALVAANVERTAQRVRSILGWQQVVADLRSIRGVTAVSPMASGPGFAARGNASKAVVVLGVEPEAFAGMYPIRSHVLRGDYAPVGDGCVIGRELADDLGVGVGDKLRLSAPGRDGDVFTVTGVFDLGNRDVNRRWVVVALRAAQTMLDLVGGVSTVDVRVADVFDAERVAGEITARTGVLADSWMKTNAQLLVALQSQSSSSRMIQFFVIVAVAMGIASVLAVSVVQKGKEIGILRATGTTRATVLGVFLIQGALVGALGSVLGIGMGSALGAMFRMLIRNADGSPTFPIHVGPELVLRSAIIALVTGILAAILPARRAARVDPVVAIRNG